jgi:hypothetical protein
MNALLQLANASSACPVQSFSHSMLVTTSAYHEEAPWLFMAVSRIHELEGRPRVYQGIGDLTVARETAMYARAVLGNLKPPPLLPIPDVGATGGGGLGFVWTVGQKQVEAIVNPDRVITFVSTTGDQITDDGEVRDDASRLEQVLHNLFVA